MEKQIIVIGIDHGWSSIKTDSQVFTTGVKEITTEPALFTNIVEFEGRYYEVGGKRLEVRELKVENDNFYILTLAAIAKELKRRNRSSANVLLAVGLPLTRFGAEKQGFIDYLSKNREINFRFNREAYSVVIERVSVFPQCYALVADQLRLLPKRVVVVDIGSWTIDIMPIVNSAPMEADCITMKEGLIKGMGDIRDEVLRQYGASIPELEIEEFIKQEGNSSLPEKYKQVIRQGLCKYADRIYQILIEKGYDLEVTQIVFGGGGAAVMRQYGKHQSDNIIYKEDVRANAKGFEQLGWMYLSSHRRDFGLE